MDSGPVSREQVTSQYLKQAAHVARLRSPKSLGRRRPQPARPLWDQQGHLWDQQRVANSPFLDPDADRYVVVSVDPAGGGALSDEVFVVFLIANDQFGLLAGRVAVGQSKRYGFSLIPLSFILALVRTLRSVRAWLQAAHGRSGRPPDAFRMPTVLVVIENNFAYGAAMYMQMLWFLRQQQPRFLPDCEVVLSGVPLFRSRAGGIPSPSTPVFGLDAHLVAAYGRLARAQRKLDEETERRRLTDDGLRRAWKDKGPRHKGTNLQELFQEIRRLRPHASTSTQASQLTEKRIAEVLEGQLDRAQAAVNDSEERHRILKAWMQEQNVLQVAVAYAEADAAFQRTQEEVRAANEAIQSYLQRNDGQEGVVHDYVRLSSLAALGEQHVVDAQTGRVTFPANAYWAAKKTVFGEQTTEKEKALAFRHFVRIVQDGGPMLVLMRDPNELTLATEGDAAAECAGCHDTDVGCDLIPAVRLLTCIHQQWSRLLVTVDPVTGKVVRVEGKQSADTPTPNNKTVHTDDIWMAFSIGMQWCVRFCRLLPNNDQRRLLVDYMRRLTQTVDSSLQESLRDAGLDSIRTDRNRPATMFRADPGPRRTSPRPRPRPPPPPAAAARPRRRQWTSPSSEARRRANARRWCASPPSHRRCCGSTRPWWSSCAASCWRLPCSAGSFATATTSRSSRCENPGPRPPARDAGRSGACESSSVTTCPWSGCTGRSAPPCTSCASCAGRNPVPATPGPSPFRT